MEHFYNKIIGWFDYQSLYRDMVKLAPQDAVFVEVGSFMGCSTAFLGVEIINSRKNIKLHCVDNWVGDEGCTEPSVTNDELRLKFIENVSPISCILNVITGDSAISASLFDDNSIDFVFIDANHTYPAVKADISAWYPKVKVGGWICGHDYEDGRGVVPAVNEAFGTDIYRHHVTWLHLKKE